jgi:hypothetical protein
VSKSFFWKNLGLAFAASIILVMIKLALGDSEFKGSTFIVQYFLVLIFLQLQNIEKVLEQRKEKD